jgi:hypothetical protein
MMLVSPSTVGPASKNYGEWNPSGLIQQTSSKGHMIPANPLCLIRDGRELDSCLARQSLAKKKHFVRLKMLAKLVLFNGQG